MGKLKEGDKFGRLSVIRYDGKNEDGKSMYLFKCDCGEETIKLGTRAKQGKVGSCGCLVVESNQKKAENNVIHGQARRGRISRTFKSWESMHQRCYNENSEDFYLYGGRGIKICSAWGDFSNFLNDMGIRPENMTIDRIDTNGDYTPENCRWASWKTQNRNRRDNRIVTFKGRDMALAEMAEITGLSWDKLFYRIFIVGKTPDDAIEV